MVVPDRTTSRRVLASLGLPDWLVTHSEGVARVAAEAARALASNGIEVDVSLVEAAGRLHDIDKLETREDGRHGLVGAQRLADLGHPELADAVAAHPVMRLLDPERAPRGWPAICVSVADRRVALGFMSIAERLDEMAARYPANAASIHSARGPAEAQEAGLAQAAGLTPEALGHRLERAWADPDR